MNAGFYLPALESPPGGVDECRGKPFADSPVVGQPAEFRLAMAIRLSFGTPGKKIDG